MSKKITIGSAPLDTKDKKAVRTYEGSVEIEFVSGRLWNLEFKEDRRPGWFHKVQIIMPDESDKIDDGNWVTQLSAAIAGSVVTNDGTLPKLQPSDFAAEVVTTFGVIDFKFASEDQWIYIHTNARTDEIKTPWSPEDLIIFKNISNSNPKPVEVIYVMDGVMARRRNYDDTTEIFKGYFNEILSPWARLYEYVGVGDLDTWKYNLYQKNWDQPTALTTRGTGEFTWIESGDGRIAFTTTVDAPQKFFTDIKQFVARTMVPDHVKQFLQNALNNLMLAETIYLRSKSAQPITTEAATLYKLLDFYRSVERLEKEFRNIGQLGYDRFENHTRY